MTDRKHDRDEQFDRLMAEIRAETMSDDAAQAAVERVRQGLSQGVERRLRDCDDYLALLPDLVANRLPEARALLVSDHTRECVGCRRRLLELRSGAAAQPSMIADAGRRWWHRPSLRMAATAVVLIGAATLAYRMIGDYAADHGVRASVARVDGALYRVADADATAAIVGEELLAGQPVRTGKGAGAVLRLDDGSMVEMAPRSEVYLRAARRGTTVHLERGNIIVEAADQVGGRLYVQTDECLVAVKGTVFAVDHGLKGSRVSVIEGEVEVRHGASRDLLEPGQQITTSDRLQQVAIERQIAWSPNAESHVALLRELTALQQEVSAAVDPSAVRTSTRLLDLAPDDTMAYAAMPNLAEGLGEARMIVEERIASSPALGAWWQQQVVANGLDQEIDEMLDRLQPLGEALGDEVVVTMTAAVFDDGPGPLVLATLDDPATFGALLAAEVERVNAEVGHTVLALLEDPLQPELTEAEMLLWVDDDLFAASTDREMLAALAARAGGSGGSFATTELYERLSEAYGRGVSWLFGVDAATFMAWAAADEGPEDAAMLEGLGLLDATTLIVERHRVDEGSAIHAELDFAGPRRGLASWLAEPAPMGSLEFMSPQASFATAVVARDAAEMFDELLGIISGVAPEAIQGLADFEAETGFDLRADLAAPLGGEAAFAVDGPMLPTPAWKLVIEVYDPTTLQATIDRAVEEIDRELQANGEGSLIHIVEELGNRTYHTISHPQSPVELVYTMVDGFLVAAPQRAVIEQALQFRASGVTLSSSAAFQGLLPDNGYTDCSALVYRNLGLLLEALPMAVDSMELPPEMAELLQQGAEPSLYCIYGESDRILVSGSGGSLLRVLPLLGLADVIDEHTAPANATGVSSEA